MSHATCVCGSLFVCLGGEGGEGRSRIIISENLIENLENQKKICRCGLCGVDGMYVPPPPPLTPQSLV